MTLGYPGLEVGATHRISLVVDDRTTVPELPLPAPDLAGMPRVFATAYLVGLAECASMGVLALFLNDDEMSVGVAVSFDHTAATPVGMTVSAEATVTAIEPRLVSFSVELTDDAGPIGSGTHTRAIINRTKFDERLARRAATIGR